MSLSHLQNRYWEDAYIVFLVNVVRCKTLFYVFLVLGSEVRKMQNAIVGNGRECRDVICCYAHHDAELRTELGARYTLNSQSPRAFFQMSSVVSEELNTGENFENLWFDESFSLFTFSGKL